ncbi:GDP-mannose 4,6-dehydratase [Halorubrum ezzemoulense]|uniref:GDP-mannose 4,6-dehydratase n=1 Tax=Halorubrum ezzemoulense TaxID=337243 RepID=UPI00232D0D83|nr:GDP-mannose 4,6-dehydratase [Halorubrum ezzemoulense]MDB2242972.1 GDP-mannose 4,6-dehydratase [Halorubrum ezzemoulense]
MTVLDNLEPFYAEGLKRHTLDVHRDVAEGRDVEYWFVEKDVRDPETLRTLVNDTDVVVHQAAQAGVRESVDNPRKVTDSTLAGW